MHKFQKIASQLLIFTNAMLVFMFLFESKIHIPNLLVPMGRLHPLLLHLPIGIFLAALLLRLLKSYFDGKSFDLVLNFLFLTAAITASLTALFGFILAQENGYNLEQLAFHKWGGILTSLLCWISYLAISNHWRFEPYAIGAAAMSVFISGHLGGEITHGKNYLLASFTNEKERVFNPDSALFDEAIFPILESKCLSCHNDKKLKGELNMSSLTGLMKGGKNGPIWVEGDVLNSHIIQNAKLPLEDKKHMPPKGKPQLSALELSILELWIKKGADMEVSLTSIPANDTLASLVKRQYQPANNVIKTYTFKAASLSDLEEVNTPFCTVKSLAYGSPALVADFFVTQKFDIESLKNLMKVKKQLVELGLAKMPMTDNDLTLLSDFENLEKLNLNFTDIKGKGLKALNANKKLESLSLSGCQLEPGSLVELNALENLKTLFVWETNLEEQDLEAFQKANPKVKVVRGYLPTDKDILKINPPMMVSKTGIVSKAQLSHSLKDVSIRYTLDGSLPDSAKSELYENDIPFEGFLNVKTIATKEGWRASDIKTFTFFKSNFKADSAWLLSEPDKQYPGVGSSTIIDQRQGDKSNFKDFAWLGFKQNDAEILVKTHEKITGITVSYLKSFRSFIVPPVQVQLWGGETKESLVLLETKYPEKLTKEERSVQYSGISFPVGMEYKYFKIVAKPLSKLPSWHPGAGQKAWVFIDEIYFY